MKQIKQCLSWWCFNKENPKRFFDEAKKIGYQAIELAPPELWPQIHDAGLEIATIAVKSIDQGLNRRENFAKLEDEIEGLIDAAVKNRIPSVIVMSGNRAGLDDETGASVTAEGLKRIAPYAESKNITLVMELLNSKVDHGDYQCDRTAWGVKVIELVNSPRVKLLYDIYHMQIMEGDVIRTMTANMKHIGHIHTAGNPGRRDLDDDQELNYRGVARAIASTNYAGYVGHEFIPKGDAIAAIRVAYDLCNV